MVRGILFGVMFFLSSCAAMSDRVPQSQMAPRLAYQGFSFERPASSDWFILRREEDYTDVTLRRDLGTTTHTFYANVSLGQIERLPESHKEFAQLARVSQVAPYPLQELTRAEQLVVIQDQWCVRTDTVADVQPEPSKPPLRMLVHGYRCLHPAFPGRTLDFFYSERGLPEEIDPSLSVEGESFLEGVRIDLGPDTPAGNAGV